MSFLESSQCLLVIVSDGILADDWCRFILNYALHLESRNLVFLLYRKVTTWTDSPEDKMLKRAIKVASHIVTWSDMAANNGRSSAVCLSCLGMDGSHSHHRTTNQPRLPQCKAMEQDHFQEGSFQMSYVGDHSLGDDNCDTNPAMTKGVHVSDSPSSNSQNILPGSVVPTISPTNTSDPSPPPDVTRCCCYQSHSSPDHTTSGDGDSTSSGQGEMNARETRLWKQLRLALPPRVHRPESERSESGTAETAILTGSNIWMKIMGHSSDFDCGWQTKHKVCYVLSESDNTGPSQSLDYNNPLHLDVTNRYLWRMNIKRFQTRLWVSNSSVPIRRKYRSTTTMVLWIRCLVMTKTSISWCYVFLCRVCLYIYT